MPWDPSTGQTFGEYMRGDNGRGPDVVLGEPTWATRDQVVEGSTPDGGRFKTVIDQAGHETTQETTPDGREKQHVRINLR